MSPAGERRALQAAVIIGAVVPVGAGAAGILVGPAAFGLPLDAPPALASHFAYLSGLLLAIGLGFWSCVPRIEAKTARIRLLAALVVLGGLGRLWALGAAGVPPVPHLLALVMELGVTPALALWQGRVARQAER